MRDYYSGEKAFAKTNVLSTEETCKILGRSRQQLNNLIKSNNIEVFKALSNSNLFWRPEVYELLRKLNREKSRVLHEVYGYYTSQALEAFHALNIDKEKVEEELAKEQKVLKPVLVPTGIKSYMQEDEYLQLANRSSNPLKHFLVLPNGVGIVDSDYYNNPDNEGHIYFQLLNFGLFDKEIKKGDRIGQGIFLPFLKADADEENDMNERTGGFGSSGVR